MPRRGVSFAKTELDYLLDVLEEILPIGPMEWEIVETKHNAIFEEKQRTKETLKRKFQNLYLTRIPTGDPTCPPHVCKAKLIYELKKQKCDISVGNDNNSDIFSDSDDKDPDDDFLNNDGINAVFGTSSKKVNCGVTFTAGNDGIADADKVQLLPSSLFNLINSRRRISSQSIFAL